MIFPFPFPTPGRAGEEPEIPARSMRIIGIALVTGALLFAGVAALLPLLGGSAGEDPNAGLVRTLSFVTAGVFVMNLGGSTVFRLRIAGDPEKNRGLWVVRWAVLEGAALLGSVTVLLAGNEGVLPAEPLYYANLLPTFAFAAVLIMDLPAVGGGD